MSEAEVQAQVVAMLKAAGARVTYHTHDARRSDEGFPDVTAPVRGAIWAVECKTSTGRLSPAQVVWANEWLRHGGRYFMATPETLDQLRDHLGLTVASGGSAWHTGATAGIVSPVRIDPDSPEEAKVHQTMHELGVTRERALAIEARTARGG